VQLDVEKLLLRAPNFLTDNTSENCNICRHFVRFGLL